MFLILTSVTGALFNNLQNFYISIIFLADNLTIFLSLHVIVDKNKIVISPSVVIFTKVALNGYEYKCSPTVPVASNLLVKLVFARIDYKLSPLYIVSALYI